MGNATKFDPPATGTIRADEAAHFGKLAADWWDPRGSSAMLHKLNPVRLGFLRDAVDHHAAAGWGLGSGNGDSRGLRPLAGRRALDVGCGAGLLAEPLARLGAAVTGVDAAAENIAAARAHAAGSGLAITYVHGDLALLGPGQEPGPEQGPEQGLGTFDLVTALEVIEHVAEKGAFVHALASALAPGGLMILSCPNRTMRSRVLLVEGAERLGLVPRGTHHWDDFITPDELRELLAAAGLTMGTPRGIAWSPLAGLHLSDDLALNFIVTATPTAAAR